MQIGYILVIALAISIYLAIRLKHKVSRIFAIAAIVSFFLVMLVMAEIPETAVTDTRSIFIASTTLAGIVFAIVTLINIFFQSIMKKPSKEKNSNNIEKEEQKK